MNEHMGIYIIEDDDTMIEILQDMIEDHELGVVVGNTAGGPAAPKAVLAARPDIILIDFLMPGKDGVALVKELRELGCTAKFIMISQVSSKDMIGKAYDAGVEFFINKPINIIEVSSVITTVTKQIRNERTIANLRSMFLSDMQSRGDDVLGVNAVGKNAARRDADANQAASGLKQKSNAAEKGAAGNRGERRQAGQKNIGEDSFSLQVTGILGHLGMAGEKGSGDIIRICLFLREQGKSMSRESIRDICGELCDSPKSMEQRMRRAISVGLTNLAHLGLEDFMNDTFTEYSSTLFPFEEIRAEMDYIRGKRSYGGKASIKKFIESLMLITERKIYPVAF